MTACPPHSFFVTSVRLGAECAKARSVNRWEYPIENFLGMVHLPASR
jgi:hypothetical protein